MKQNPFQTYLQQIDRACARGDATEHTHRPALKQLLEALDPKINAVNEPKRRTDCGAPDIRISRQIRKLDQTVGYIECKDIGFNLTQAAKSEQIKKRYLPSLPNFILTDYLEFRWYADAQLRQSCRLAEPTKDGKYKTSAKGKQELQELLHSFLLHESQRLTTAKDLARRMASLARLLRDVIQRTFQHEPEKGALHEQMKAFREVLLHELTENQFADMYAQTISYGLFAAVCNLKNPTKFTREHAAYDLPKTNPFLRKMFSHIAGPDLDERITWLVDDLAALLRLADLASILADFGKRRGKEDPVVHFYETFLAQYDPKLRETRGVYYTPEPVVSYIVRSIDFLLRSRFGLAKGLADNSTIRFPKQRPAKNKANGSVTDWLETHKCLILDPAVGTGTFLYAVINEIHQKFARQKGAWSPYVAQHLLPRLFGFELLMAPYAVAHMKLGLLLEQTGYEFQSDQRLNIFLTNTLEEAEETSKTLFAQWLSEEAAHANQVKKELPIMVVLGNPPYSGHSANRSWKLDEKGKRIPTFIGRLIKDYYLLDGNPLCEKTSKWLQDDYVKFIRFGQWRIQQTGSGILTFITNHGYLDNPTFRGMRQQLMEMFTEIYILDLHGNTKKKEVCPDGSKDENVFDIQQCVTIGIFVKEPIKEGPAKLFHSEFWGLRKDKYQRLNKENISKIQWQDLYPQKPFYLFKPQDVELSNEYKKGMKINEIMPLNGVGMTTARDHVVIDFEVNPIIDRAEVFRDSPKSDTDVCIELGIPLKKGWDVNKARKLLRQVDNLNDFIKIVTYRPFDNRFIFYHDSLVWRTVKKIMIHMFSGTNLGLCIGRAGQVIDTGEWNIIFCTNNITEFNLYRRGGNNLLPIYIYPDPDGLIESSPWEPGQNRRVPNLDETFVRQFAENLKLEFVSDGRGDLKKSFGPEDVLAYIYAVFHCPAYRTRYAEFLKIDFPRVPLTSDKKLFQKLVPLGQKLIHLHLLDDPDLDTLITSYPIDGSNTVEKAYPKFLPTAPKSVSPQLHVGGPKSPLRQEGGNDDYKNSMGGSPSRREGSQPETRNEEPGTCLGRVHINTDQYFDNVPHSAWEFHVGGYQVLHKWLKDRKDRTLSFDDLNHYQKIVKALTLTIDIMNRIDQTIHAHNGFPLK